MPILSLTILVLFLSKVTFQSILNHHDDSTYFDINWDREKLNHVKNDENFETLTVKSSQNEIFECLIPKTLQDDSLSATINENEIKSNLTIIEMLDPLFSQKYCSYYMELYWTYEICHGKYARQYHELTDGSKIRQVFTMGQMSSKEMELLAYNLKTHELEGKLEIPSKKFNNINRAYLEIVMGDGMECEVKKNHPRQIKVIYVCDEKGKNNIESIKETSTCVYEAIILTPLLCQHDKFKPTKTVTHQIECYSIENDKKIPKDLAKIYGKRRNPIDKSFSEREKSEFLSYTEEIFPSTYTKLTNLDKLLIENFLSGKSCIIGGNGFWKYEFCYGKSLEQFHLVETRVKSGVINLGNFDREKHIEWLKKNPQKRPKPLSERDYFTHLYTDGCVCNVTHKPRQTEVKLKCMKDVKNLNALGMYLFEPNYGQYVFGIESPLICHILSRVDDDGLITDET